MITTIIKNIGLGWIIGFILSSTLIIIYEKIYRIRYKIYKHDGFSHGRLIGIC